MPATRLYIFANPIAGRGQGRLLARRIEREAITDGFAVQTFFDRPSDLSLANLTDKPDHVVAIGGDGTVAGVVNLFYSDHAKGPSVLPVPMGTANLMGRHLGINWTSQETPRAVIDTLKRNKITRLDAGRANGRLFLLMAGVGIDAQVVHLLDSMRRGPIDMTHYFLPMAMTFASYTFPPISVRVDDQLVLSKTHAIAIIGNVKEYGTGIPMTADAVPNDGLLDVCIMPCHDRRELIEVAVAIAAQEQAFVESAIYTRGRRVHIESKENVPVQIDGDSAGFTPLEVEVVPGRVPFLVPV
jgi:YegS/Rv2252/BmrU family lipid kinase